MNDKGNNKGVLRTNPPASTSAILANACILRRSDNDRESCKLWWLCFANCIIKGRRMKQKLLKNNWQHALDLTSVTPLLVLIIFCLNSTLDIPVIVIRGKDSQKRKKNLRKYMIFFKYMFQQFFCHLQFWLIQSTKLNLTCITKCSLDKTKNRN